MNRESTDQLIQKLMSKGLLVPDIDASASVQSPWYIKTMHGISGWIASMFLLFSLGIMFHGLLNNATAMLVVGLIFVGAAYMLIVSQEDNPFLGQFTITLSLAGQAMVTFGLFSFFRHSLSESSLPWYLLSIFELALVYLIPNYLHRLLSGFVFGYALMSAVYISGLGTLGLSVLLGATVWIWFSEFQHPRCISCKLPLGFSLSLVLFANSLFGHPGYYIWNNGSLSHYNPNLYWLSISINTAILLYVVWRLTDKEEKHITPLKILAVIFALGIGILGSQMGGLVAGIVILLVAFSRGNMVLVGLSVAQLIWSISHYYYTLHATLLTKSLYLIGTGVVLILLYYLFKRFVVDSRQKEGTV
jgi:uncharacterized membrane protein